MVQGCVSGNQEEYKNGTYVVGAQKHPSVSTSPPGRQELPHLIPVGVQAWYDTKQLADLGIRLKNFIDLGTLTKQHLPNSPSGYSMRALAERY
jgi:hypothetical protein